MPNTLMIEALIGFTIIFIAAEYMIKDSKLSNKIVSILVSILVLIGLSSLVLEIPISLITSFALILITIGYFGIIKSIKNFEVEQRDSSKGRYKLIYVRIREKSEKSR